MLVRALLGGSHVFVNAQGVGCLGQDDHFGIGVAIGDVMEKEQIVGEMVDVQV